MMFRSLFFAPLLVAADVEEQSVLLQMKGRAETQVLMQRASEGIGSETLRSLEMGLMAKGPKKVETAKCAYHMKTPKKELYAGKTPCEAIDVLEEVYEDSLDNFEDFRKIGEKAVAEVMKVVDASLKQYPDVNLTKTFEWTPSTMKLNETKFHKVFAKAIDKKLGAEMNETDIYASLNPGKFGEEHDIFTEATEAFSQLTDVQESVVSMMKGEDIGVIELSENDVNVTFTLNVTAMQELAATDKKGRSDARKMIDTYAKTKLGMYLNLVGDALKEHWEDTLGYAGPEDEKAEDPLDIDWSDKKAVGNAEKKFWVLASGFADDANVEDICKSEQFNAKKPILKKVCKGSSKPKCLDELMYLEETDGTDGICETATKMSGKYRGKKFTDSKFVTYCNSTNDKGDDTEASDCQSYFRDTTWVYCKRVNDIRKGCKRIVKFNKQQARKVLKAQKKAFKTAKKACYKACKKVARKDRRACKKECKTDFHKDNLDDWTAAQANKTVAAATTE